MGAAGSAKRRRKEETLAQPVYSIQVQPKSSATMLFEEAIEEEKQAQQARTDLWAAAYSGDLETVDRILGTYGRDPSVVDAASPSATVRNRLTSANAPVDGDAPLALACRAGHVEVVRVLLKAEGVDVNRMNDMSEEGGTALTIVSENGNAALVSLLLSDCRVQVNSPRADGCTALFMASQNGHTDVVQRLLAAPGVDVETADLKYRFTPLIIAACKGRHAAAAALLQASADASARTPDSYSALVIAVDRHDPILHAALLMHGADASAVHSPLLRACVTGAAMAARGALERCRWEGRPPSEDAQLSPLHVACLLGDTAGVEACLKAAAAHGPASSLRAASVPDASGLGALYYAVELGELQAARLVLKALGVGDAVVARASAAIPEGAPLLSVSSKPLARPNVAAGTSGDLVGVGSERPGTAPARASAPAETDGSAFFRAVVMPFVEDRIYVTCGGAKELLLAYLGSVAAARFFMREASAFRSLHALSVRGLRAIEERLEGVFQREGLGEAFGRLGSEVPARPEGGRQDSEGLLPTFPVIHGYGPTATFYEDDYIDALQMLSLALDKAFFEKVEGALCSTDCKLRHPPIKSRTRMRNKLGDPDDHLHKRRPRPAHNIDTMRCAATFADARNLTRGFSALVEAFGTPVRVKNGFRPEFEPHRSYGYRSVMLNLRFDTRVTFEEVFGGGQDHEVTAEWDFIAEGQASRESSLAKQRILREWFRHEAVRPARIAMAAEVQLILAPYLQARKESHLLYKVARCQTANALVSDAAGRALAGEVREGSALVAATRRMQDKVAQLVEGRCRLPPNLEIISCSTIDIEDEDDERSHKSVVANIRDFMKTLSSAENKYVVA
mmetsp:Transcript_27652/g.82507  ORF Transcript_27652/g.82507 Transcript_27652/m.82507 type:complete len:851 (+) Transcript_27652:71-2623(+)